MKKLMMIPVCLLSLMSLVSCGDDNASEGSGNSWFSDLFGDSESLKLEASSEAIKNQLQNSAQTTEDEVKLDEFYRQRNYNPAWNDPEELKTFHQHLQRAEDEGLSYSNYQGKKIDEYLRENKILKGEEAAKFDVLVTASFLKYAHDLYYGQLDPQKLNEHWGVKREDRDLGAVLQKALQNGNVGQALEDLKPYSQVYRDLKTSLQEYRKLRESDSTTTQIEAGDMIKPGESDERIPKIARRLQELQLLSSKDSIQSNSYSPQIRKAVERFQESLGVEVDGIIGNTTIEQLNKGADERYKQILANLERWRWYPRDLGDHYILINIPDYQLAVVKDGDTVREHNVIAGTEERPTPIFSDTVQYIVINPEWTVPPTIKSEDVIPKARNNSSYLSRNNMKVTNASGEEIDPSQIDWSNAEEAESYNFVQRAGPSNPLGRLKIIYPNQYLIYLHDTPAKSLFQQSERAESSGCVRVEGVIDLAAYLLEKKENWNKEKIQEVISSGETTQVKVNRPIQVHHFYWTAWRAGGETVFVKDVYKLDDEIYSRLTQS